MSDFFDDVFTAYCNSYNECASCPLGKETGDCRDLFEKRVIGWAKAHDTACVKSATPATDTDVDGKNGKDTNVPTTLPKWCKKGQWVTDLGTKHSLGIIEHVSGEWITVRMEKHPIGRICVGGCFDGFSPIRFRPYTYEEAKGLLGKKMEYTVKSVCSSVRHSMLICKVSVNDNNGDTFIHSCRFSDWVGCEATIDGVPIGVPEVDEEAMKKCGEE